MQVVVLGVALVAGLRPPTLLVVLGFDALNLRLTLDRVDCNDHDSRRMRIGEEDGVAWVLVDQPRERIQMRPIGYGQVVAGNRRGERDGFEQVGAGA